MAGPNIEWFLIRGPLAVLFFSIAIAATLLWGGMSFRDRMAGEYHKHQAHYQGISTRYLAVDEEERIVRTLYPRFVDLYHKGIIGEEKRLNWLETLQGAGDRIRLPGLKFQIDARRPYQPTYLLPEGSYNTYSTSMMLSLELLHEGDLARLLKELNQRADGLYSVKNCELTRANETIQFDPKYPNIHAECELLWFSLELGDGQETLL